MPPVGQRQPGNEPVCPGANRTGTGQPRIGTGQPRMRCTKVEIVAPVLAALFTDAHRSISAWGRGAPGGRSGACVPGPRRSSQPAEALAWGSASAPGHAANQIGEFLQEGAAADDR